MSTPALLPMLVLVLVCAACAHQKQQNDEPFTATLHGQFPPKAGLGEAHAACASRTATIYALTDNVEGALLVFRTCMHEAGYTVR